MRPLKIGIGGVRGVVGETFTPELAAEFAQALGTYLGRGQVLISRDTRTSGPMVASAVTSGLMAAGCEVVDLGICPTPTLQLAVPWLNARGGIAISAGHNPSEWNALKFVRFDGLYLNAAQADELLDLYHQGEFAKARWQEVPSRVLTRDAISHHVATLTGRLDLGLVAARGLRVALDCCNGACARLTPAWLEGIGCTVLAINDDVTAPFPHSPEPSRRTAAQVASIVRAGGADVGFVHDADGERLALVDETGRALSEETTLALACHIALQRRPGVVVTNVSTSSAIERIASAHGSQVIRTPIGQPFISDAILAHGAVIGGEGNGAVAVPEVHATHDAAACIGIIVRHLVSGGETMSSLVAALPTLAMVKDSFPVEPQLLYSVLQTFREQVSDLPDAEVDTTDGVKLTWADGWLHVRASNTESILRVIAEADTPQRARDLADWGRDKIRI